MGQCHNCIWWLKAKKDISIAGVPPGGAGDPSPTSGRLSSLEYWCWEEKPAQHLALRNGISIVHVRQRAEENLDILLKACPHIHLLTGTHCELQWKDLRDVRDLQGVTKLCGFWMITGRTVTIFPV